MDEPEYVFMLGIATLLDGTHISVKFMEAAWSVELQPESNWVRTQWERLKDFYDVTARGIIGMVSVQQELKTTYWPVFVAHINDVEGYIIDLLMCVYANIGNPSTNSSKGGMAEEHGARITIIGEEAIPQMVQPYTRAGMIVE